MEHCKLFVGGLSRETNEDTLREYFSKYGTVEETLVIRCRDSGLGRGFGFVIFTDSSMADEALRHNNHVILGKKVDVKRANPKEDKEELSNGNGDANGTITLRTKKIFVGGLPPDITEEEFKSYFDSFGSVTDAVVIYDKESRRPRGFGFITYDSEDAVDNVLKNRYHELKNKMVEVKRAEPKDKNGQNMNCYEPKDMNDNYMSCYDCYNIGLGFGGGFSYGNSDIFSSFPPCYYPAFQTTGYYHSWNPYRFVPLSGGWGSPLLVPGSNLNGSSSCSLNGSSSGSSPGRGLVASGNHAVHSSYFSYPPFGVCMNGRISGEVDLTNHNSSYQQMADSIVNGNSNGDDNTNGDDNPNGDFNNGIVEIAANTKSLKTEDLSSLKTSSVEHQGGEASSKNRAEIHISTAQEAVLLTTKSEHNGKS